MTRLHRALALIPALFLAAPLASPGWAQQSAIVAPQYYVPRDMAELEQLTAPVALYPDAVLAETLVACTYPLDVVRAAQWLDAGNNPAAIENQDWDPSVQGIAHYPGILHDLASNVDWMNDLGDAFLNQEADVMNAVQNLRAQALAAGNLASDPQQQVIVDGSIIQIIPADPDIIYVPIYDPQVVYVRHVYPVGQPIRPLIRFAPGIRVGAWLRHDVDWHDRAIYTGAWGADRPWWHHDVHADAAPRYANIRPGTYRPTPRALDNHPEQTGRWTHDTRKPAPRPTAHPGGRSPAARPGAGYAPRPAENPVGEARQEKPNLPGYGNGPTVSRQSNRGQVSRGEASRGEASRGAAAPGSAQPPPQVHEVRPARSAQPVRAQPIRPEPARAQPARAEPARAQSIRNEPAQAQPARPQPPSRENHASASAAARSGEPQGGAAVGGYQNGADASRSSSRGAASRGAAAGHR